MKVLTFEYSPLNFFEASLVLIIESVLISVSMAILLIVVKESNFENSVINGIECKRVFLLDWNCKSKIYNC